MYLTFNNVKIDLDIVATQTQTPAGSSPLLLLRQPEVIRDIFISDIGSIKQAGRGPVTTGHWPWTEARYEAGQYK